jgi:hypothetical protein
LIIGVKHNKKENEKLYVKTEQHHDLSMSLCIYENTLRREIFWTVST